MFKSWLFTIFKYKHSPPNALWFYKYWVRNAYFQLWQFELANFDLGHTVASSLRLFCEIFMNPVFEFPAPLSLGTSICSLNCAQNSFWICFFLSFFNFLFFFPSHLWRLKSILYAACRKNSMALSPKWRTQRPKSRAPSTVLKSANGSLNCDCNMWQRGHLWVEGFEVKMFTT